MIKTLKYLILIRFRKIISKDDYTAMALIIAFYVVAFYCLNLVFPLYKYYFLLGTLELMFYHQNRKDLELLKLSKNYRLLLFLEYLLYSFPYLLIYAINNRFDLLLLHSLLLIVLLSVKKANLKILKYPFKLFDPFWHISFRTNKLIVFIPLIVFLNVIGNQYHNENLNIATLLIVGIIGCIPSFKREEVIYIKTSAFDSKKYLIKQIQTTLSNTLLISLVAIICLVSFQKWDLLVFVPCVFLFPVISILFKYAYFTNVLLHQLFFVLFIVTMQIGLPFLLLPFLYFKSIKTINELHYAGD